MNLCCRKTCGNSCTPDTWTAKGQSVEIEKREILHNNCCRFDRVREKFAPPHLPPAGEENWKFSFPGRPLPTPHLHEQHDRRARSGNFAAERANRPLVADHGSLRISLSRRPIDCEQVRWSSFAGAPEKSGPSGVPIVNHSKWSRGSAPRQNLPPRPSSINTGTHIQGEVTALKTTNATHRTFFPVRGVHRSAWGLEWNRIPKAEFLGWKTK